MQLASSCGPADLRMVVVTDRPAHWDCIRSLPHLGLPDGSVAVISEPELTALLADLGEHHAHLLFVTDQPRCWHPPSHSVVHSPTPTSTH